MVLMNLLEAKDDRQQSVARRAFGGLRKERAEE